MDSFRSLQSRPFTQSTLEEKVEVKRLCLNRPQLLTKPGLCSRRFTKTWYSMHSWLAGRSHSGKFYCFPCLHFGDFQREKAWTQSDVNDWCSCHIGNCLTVAIFGKRNIAEQLSVF